MTRVSPLEQVGNRFSTMGSALPSGLSLKEKRKLEALLEGPIDFMDDEHFYEDDAYAQLFESDNEIPQPNTQWYSPLSFDDRASNAMSDKANVLLNGNQERQLFLQFNYARYRCEQLRQHMQEDRIELCEARDLLKWHDKAMYLRERIAEFNLALVLAMVRRFQSTQMDFGEMVSEGNLALLRAIDKFNVSRGFKFSTYACRAILKAFGRMGGKTTRYRDLFPVEFDPELERSNYSEEVAMDRESQCAGEIKRIFEDNSASLTEVEHAVIRHRFGLAGSEERRQLTLDEVGRLVGLTKERVRQIQNKALVKIRETLEKEYLDKPAMASSTKD